MNVIIKLLISLLIVFNLKAKTPPKPIGLDVRSYIELKMNPAPGAVSISVGNVKEEVEKKIKDKNAPIHVFCEAGVRAKKALKTLQELGYTNVKNIGSWREWNASQKPKEEANPK